MTAVLWMAVALLGVGLVVGLLLAALIRIDEAIDAAFERKYQRLDDPLEILTGVPTEDEQ